jgi:hypothetical protein
VPARFVWTVQVLCVLPYAAMGLWMLITCVLTDVLRLAIYRAQSH